MDAFREAIENIAFTLKECGSSRKDNTFYIRQFENWGLINFQKSRNSSASNVIFTINLGTCSKLLIEFFTPEKINEKPSIEDCHWRQRIGMLLPEHSDKWWSITNQTSIAQFIKEIQDCLHNKGIPEIKRYMANEQLQSLWLSGQSPGLTDIQRLMNLSVLLKASGAIDQLEMVSHQLEKLSKGKPTAPMARQHLSRLQRNRSE
jgi:hypothetical protein